MAAIRKGLVEEASAHLQGDLANPHQVEVLVKLLEASANHQAVALALHPADLALHQVEVLVNLHQKDLASLLEGLVLLQEDLASQQSADLEHHQVLLEVKDLK